MATTLTDTRVAAARPAAATRRHPRLHRTLDVALQVALCLGGVAVYFGVRGLTEGRPEAALRNATRVLELEQAIGLRHEDVLQDAVIGSRALTRFLNWVYIFGHWPVLVVVLTWLLVRHRDVFRTVRDAMFASGLAGMVVFATFPVAPPRLSAVGMVDTVTLGSQAYRVLQPAAFTNQYAAMPSLHVGWDLLAGLAIWAAARHLWLRVVGVAMPLLMAAAVVLTANHYVLDVLVGAALAGLAWGGARRLAVIRARRARRPAPPDPC